MSPFSCSVTRILSILLSLLLIAPTAQLCLANSDSFIVASARARLASPAKTWSGVATRNTLDQLPLAFEENTGLVDRRVRFFARGDGYGVFLTNKGAVLALHNPGPASRDATAQVRGRSAIDVLRWEFEGAAADARIAGADELGPANYFLGTQRNWSTGNRRFNRIRYQNLYRGIDLVYYGNSKHLEYDLVLAPHANAHQIRFKLGNGKGLSLDPNGNLVIRTKAGEIALQRPVAYQIVGGNRRDVTCSFRINQHNHIVFEVGAYDHDAELTIDPTLVYSTYLGGSGFSSSDDEVVNGVAVDNQGNAYVVGSTVSTDFPVLNAYKSNGGGFLDVFVSKINPTGTALIYSTYLGGNRADQGLGIAVDASGSAYVTGVSASTDFPTTPGAFQTTGLDTDVFVAKLSPSGNSLVYSTLLSGDRIPLTPGSGLASSETGFGIAVDSQGQAIVAGQTQSANFPHAHEFQASGAGGFDAFVTKLNATGSGLIFSTYLGGSTTDQADAVAVDSADNVYVSGETYSTDFPVTAGSFKTSRTASNSSIGFVTKFSAAGSLIYSTYLGDSFDRARSIAVDSFGNAFVTGETQSANFPVTANAIKPKPKVGDFFISSDGGVTWRSSSGFAGDVAVNAVAIDPVTPGKLFIGTPAGLFSSTDGGNSWSLLGLANISVLSLAIDPANPVNIFAGTSGQGIFKSTNGGSSWTNPMTTGTIVTLAFRPQDSTRIYAGTSGSGLQSSDSGEHWTSLGAGGGSIKAFAFAPGNPDTIYLAANNGVIKTIDAGVNWTNVLSVGFPFSGIVIDPTNAATVYAANQSLGVYKTTNAGQNWTQSNVGPNTITSLAIDDTTSPATVYAGGDGGLYKTVNGAQSWQLTGLTYSTVKAISASHQTPGVLYAGASVSGNLDAFLSKLSADGSSLLYSTYLGGGGFDTAFGVALDQSGNPVIVGYGSSLDFPQVNALRPRRGTATDAFVMKLDMATNAISFSSFVGGSGIDSGRGVAVDSANNIYVVGTTRSSDFPSATGIQPALNNIYDGFVTKITNGTAQPNVSFASAAVSVSEAAGQATISIVRSGDLSQSASVDYTTSDTSGASRCGDFNGVASSRCDYLKTLGTLHFAANESSRSISIPIVDDTYAEGTENFNITLSNPSGVSLAAPFQATITIVDNDTVSGPNPIDTAAYFVRQHYFDFLNRQPDQSGLDFWTGQMTNCGASDLTVCRVNVSGGFFLSIEFQQTGYLVERIYKVAYGDEIGNSTLGGPHQLAVPVVRFNEFLKDTQRIGQGVVVLQPGWEQALESNKQAYAGEFVASPRFFAGFPTSLTPAALIDRLNQNAGNVLSASERTAAINLFNGAADTSNLIARAQAVRQVAEDPDLYQAESNRAFVLAQYFGYLRRNPNDPQDTDYTGYEFWLNKLNQFNGDYVAAEMVKAFIASSEYRQRFGP
jgi:hypothetical protein